MKNLKLTVGVLMLFLAVAPFSTKADIVKDRTPSDPRSVADVSRAENLVNRLEEIEILDKSDMTRSEKKQLRAEVKSIKKELKELGGGIYLSVGAVIIIILLLILLL